MNYTSHFTFWLCANVTLCVTDGCVSYPYISLQAIKFGSIQEIYKGKAGVYMHMPAEVTVE